MKLKPIICLLALVLLTSGLFSQTAELLQRPVQHERVRFYDALHYKIVLDIDLSGKSFKGTNTVSLVPLSSGMKKFSFDIAELTIDQVTDSDGSELNFSNSDTDVTVIFENAFSPADTVSFLIHYTGNDPSDGLIFDDKTEKWPKMACSNSWPDRARYWYPCSPSHA